MGDKNVKFVDVEYGDVGMTMVVLLGGGSKRYLAVSFLIFQNCRRPYDIEDITIAIPEVF